MRNNNALHSANYENTGSSNREDKLDQLNDYDNVIELFPSSEDIAEPIEQLQSPTETVSKQENRIGDIIKASTARREVANALSVEAIPTENTAARSEASYRTASAIFEDAQNRAASKKAAARNTDNAKAVLENLSNTLGNSSAQPLETQNNTPSTVSEKITIGGQAEKMKTKFGPMMQERARVAREANKARAAEIQAPEEPSGRHSEAPGRVSFAETMANAKPENREAAPTPREAIRSIGNVIATPATVKEAPSIEAIREAVTDKTEKMKIGERLTARADKIPDGMPAIKEAIAEKGGLKGILKKAWMKATFRSDARRAKRLNNKEARLTRKQEKISEKLDEVQLKKEFQAEKIAAQEKEKIELSKKARAARVAKLQRKQNRQQFRQESYSNIKQSVSESRIGRTTANAARKSNQYVKGEKIATKPKISPEERAVRMAELSE